MPEEDSVATAPPSEVKILEPEEFRSFFTFSGRLEVVDGMSSITAQAMSKRGDDDVGLRQLRMLSPQCKKPSEREWHTDRS